MSTVLNPHPSAISGLVLEILGASSGLDLEILGAISGLFLGLQVAILAQYRCYSFLLTIASPRFPVAPTSYSW